MKYCSSSRVHKTKRALYLRVSFLRNGGRVSLTKKNLQKMNFSAASLKKKKPMKIRQPKNKNLQKNELQLCQLIAAAVKKKNRHSQKQQIIVQTIIAHISIFISTFCFDLLSISSTSQRLNVSRGFASLNDSFHVRTHGFAFSLFKTDTELGKHLQ
jgi:hypothetical protein